MGRGRCNRCLLEDTIKLATNAGGFVTIVPKRPGQASKGETELRHRGGYEIFIVYPSNSAPVWSAWMADLSSGCECHS